MIEYIHANTVRRGLVESPDDWKWSSAGWHEGKNSLRPDVIDFGGLTNFSAAESAGLGAGKGEKSPAVRRAIVSVCRAKALVIRGCESLPATWSF